MSSWRELEADLLIALLNLLHIAVVVGGLYFGAGWVLTGQRAETLGEGRLALLSTKRKQVEIGIEPTWRALSRDRAPHAAC